MKRWWGGIDWETVAGRFALVYWIVVAAWILLLALGYDLCRRPAASTTPGEARD